MVSWFNFAIFVFVFILSHFSIKNCLSNTILVTRTISPVNDTTIMVSLSFNGNSDCTFFVFQTILTLHFPLVKWFNLLINIFPKFSLLGENGRWIVNRYIFFHLANINTRKKNRYRPSHWAAINCLISQLFAGKAHSS